MTLTSDADLTPEQRALAIEEAHDRFGVGVAMVAIDHLRAAEQRGRERGLEEAARLRAQLKDAARTIRNGVTALREVARLVETQRTREALLIVAHGLVVVAETAEENAAAETPEET